MCIPRGLDNKFIIVEEDNAYMMKLLLQSMDVVNKNRRIYPGFNRGIPPIKDYTTIFKDLYPVNKITDYIGIATITRDIINNDIIDTDRYLTIRILRCIYDTCKKIILNPSILYANLDNKMISSLDIYYPI